MSLLTAETHDLMFIRYLKTLRDGRMAYMVKCLLLKHEDLSLVPRIHVKMPLCLACGGSLSARDSWGSLASWPGPVGEFQVNAKVCLKGGRQYS